MPPDSRRAPSPHRPPPRFAQIGRPAPGTDSKWSRPLILLIAIGVFAALLALLWEVQRRERLIIVEVSFIEEEVPAVP